MNRSFLVYAVFPMLSGCATIDGVYEPACIAYEGDRIELRNGRFEWDRFTDEHRVDADGNLIDAFPDYPKSGQYKIDDGRLTFLTDSGNGVADWFLVEHLGQYYLLTSSQHEAFVNQSDIPECALLRASTGS